MTRTVAAATVSMAIVGFCMPVVIGVLQRLAVLDMPNHRSSHRQPVPRGGGIAVAIGIGGAVVVTRPDGDHIWIAVGLSMAFGALGLVDDVRALGPLVRLGVQLVLGLAAGLAFAEQGGLIGVAAIALVALWVAGFVNSFNFMDGVNGISALSAIAIGVTWWRVGVEIAHPFVGVGGAALAGASLAFFPWNGPRARVFLGDVGSYLIGSWIALLGVSAWIGGIEWWLVAWPTSIYLADTAMTAGRRVLRGQHWYESHREHAYQRVVACGWPHLAAAAMVAAGCALTGGVTLAVVRADLSTVAGAIALVAVVVTYLAVPVFVERGAVRERSAA